MDLSQPLFQWLLVGVALLTALLPMQAARLGWPALHLVSRWLRWFLFAFFFAYLIRVFEWSYRPDWVHFVTGFGLWFFLETGYYWLAIKALSKSEMPLFPKFDVNRDGDEWPAESRSIKVREWLREHKYRRLEALKAPLIEDILLRASVYESEDGLHRVQILFIPNRKGGSHLCFSIFSRDATGDLMLTDNHFLPFGGYYPENWSVVRRPLVGALPRLLRLHRKRLNRSGFEAVRMEDAPLHEINEQQRMLEKTNLMTGFLTPHQQQEEEGKISVEGRYRLWKEMWLLAYVGRSVSN